MFTSLIFSTCKIRVVRILPYLILTTLYFQTRQKMASQVKVRKDRFLLYAHHQTVSQGASIGIRRFWEIYRSQGVFAQLIEPTWRKYCRTDILQQMRLIHRIPFSPQEVETFRQLVFNNLTHGLKYLLDAMEDMDLAVSPRNRLYVELVEGANDLRDGEIFPQQFYKPLRQLWNDLSVQQAWERGNEAALPEKYASLLFPGCKSLTVLI